MKPTNIQVLTLKTVTFLLKNVLTRKFGVVRPHAIQLAERILHGEGIEFSHSRLHYLIDTIRGDVTPVSYTIKCPNSVYDFDIEVSDGRRVHYGVFTWAERRMLHTAYTEAYANRRVSVDIKNKITDIDLRKLENVVPEACDADV